MSHDTYVPKLDRRTTLVWLSLSVGGAAMPTLALGRPGQPPATAGYGVDPKLTAPTPAPWPRILSPEQLAQLAILSDLMLPAEGSYPAPSAVGVPEFIDEWVSAPYKTQLADREVILEGLTWLDAQSRLRSRMDWRHASDTDRRAILDRVATPGAPQADNQHAFFLRARFLIVGAYYTTEAGVRELGYIGNVPLAAYPEVRGEFLAQLETRLHALGL